MDLFNQPAGGEGLARPLSRDILRCNPVTVKYGLTLTPEQALTLARRRTELLRSAGRVELGASVLPELILAFCDSPYIDMMHYEQILSELLEIFFLLKNELGGRLSDGELIERMKTLYNDEYGGSLDALRDTPSEAFYGTPGADCPEETDAGE